MRSSTWRNTLVLALAATFAAGAQTIQVYSPFTRIDPFGAIVPADRGTNPPREILSPALPRNATTGFHLVVEGEPGTEFVLYVGQNPDNAAAVRVYREKYVKAGQTWIPDALEPVELPFRGRIATDGIPGQTAQAFWLDLRISRDAEVQRVKIEPQISVGTRWIRYPMEARIVVTAAPAGPMAVVPAAALTTPADYTARRSIKQKLCGISEKFSSGSPLTIRDFIARDAAQDVAMASVVPVDTLWEAVGANERTSWCKGEQPHPDGPEWYLRVRDRIIGSRQ